MIHIRKIKTMYGLKYAVVDLFTHYPPSVNKYGKVTIGKKTEYMTVDYKSGKDTLPAIFDLTVEGLSKAKEVQKVLKKR